MNRFSKLSNEVLTLETDEKTNSRVLYCQACTTVNSDRKTHVDQHLKNVQHFRDDQVRGAGYWKRP